MEKVSVINTHTTTYPQRGPFHPSEEFPEYPFKGHISQERNNVYSGVRECFIKMGYDTANLNTDKWNPLGHIIKPGMKVVIKPNFVMHTNWSGQDVFSVITHPSVLRAVTDYCWIALKGEGRIIIADAPQHNCNFNKLSELAQLQSLIQFYRQFTGPQFDIYDLRDFWTVSWPYRSTYQPLPGDNQGSVVVNLGKKSSLYGMDPKNFYGALYNRKETISHHSGEKQEYQFSKTILGADVFISVPKMKVHAKVGVTLNIKGMVGANTNKNYLVHTIWGSPSEGGDAYPDNFLTKFELFLEKLHQIIVDHCLSNSFPLFEWCYRIYERTGYRVMRKLGLTVGKYKGIPKTEIMGAWYGLEACPRMAADCSKIIYFADKNGSVHTTQQRPMLTIIDGIVGGELRGPMTCDPKKVGILVGSESFLAADITATRLMGFDPFNLKMYKFLLDDKTFDFGIHGPDDIKVISDDEKISGCLYDKDNRFFNFKPSRGYQGHIEINPEEAEKFI